MRIRGLSAHAALVVTLFVACGGHTDDAGNAGGPVPGNPSPASPSGTSSGGSTGSSGSDQRVHQTPSARTVATADAGVADATGVGKGPAVAPDAQAPDSSVVPDAGVVADASDAEAVDACVSVDIAAYDRSCQTQGDCIVVTVGTVCRNQCAWCGNAAINVAGVRQYTDLVSPLAPFGSCNCGSNAGIPSCVQGQCTICSMSRDGQLTCPDAG
jgi:hypothetical protein